MLRSAAARAAARAAAWAGGAAPRRRCAAGCAAGGAAGGAGAAGGGGGVRRGADVGALCAALRSAEDVDALVRRLPPRALRDLRARLRLETPIRATFASQDFEAFDLNKDGVISREEWEAVRAGGGDDSDKRQLTWDELRALALVSAVPFVGFGFCDNMIMITSGDLIEAHVGKTFMLSTMAAAALGNMVSDVAGISLAKYIEQGATALGFRPPPLPAVLAEAPAAQVAKLAGCAGGVLVGCWLGMAPLFFGFGQ